MSLGDGLRNALGTFAAAAFTAVVTELLQREQRARAQLSAAHEQLRGQAAQAEELATTRERNRLARDIHDGLGHHLTVVQMQVQAARALLPVDPERADAVLAGAQQQATDALAAVRRSVASLREPQGRPALRVALEALAVQTSDAGLPARLEVVGTPRAVTPEVEEALFRAAQEGLTNVRKHAGARTARIVLDFGEAGTTRLEVSDDGRGLGTGGGAPGFGLLGLRERADRLGGRVDLSSVPGQGTALRLEVPA
jgi:signal transduction histidine kinase